MRVTMDIVYRSTVNFAHCVANLEVIVYNYVQNWSAGIKNMPF